MTDTTLRRMIGSVLIFMFVYQVGTAVSGLASAAVGVVTAIVVAIVTFLCARRANMGPGNKAWFLVPAVLFTVLPLALSGWQFFSRDTSSLTLAINFVPLLFGFVLPAFLLWLAYAELRRRTIER